MLPRDLTGWRDSSVNVFQPSHSGHLPSHFGTWCPQDWHTWTTEALAIIDYSRWTDIIKLIKRINQVVDTGLVELKDDYKIYWKNYPIAKLISGSDYLNPQIHLIIDEMIEKNEKIKLSVYLQKWINAKVETELKSLIDLKNIKDSNTELRALAYHLYENNGVVKREEVLEYIKVLDQKERKILRDIGVKFGRYHIYLDRLLKPEAVSLRLILWKNFYQKHFDFKPPTFGLNFLESKKSLNKNFMLICGFEKFDNFFVRIDILERLFVQIINSNPEKKNEIKLKPEMLNLLGCSKDNFLILIKKMNYKTYQKEKEFYFKYLPMKNKTFKNNKQTLNNNSPFNILKKINFKD